MYRIGLVRDKILVQKTYAGIEDNVKRWWICETKQWRYATKFDLVMAPLMVMMIEFKFIFIDFVVKPAFGK